MYSHLIVPLDGSPLALEALHPSAAMARSFDATLILVGPDSALSGLDVDNIHAPDVVAVRTEVDLAASLERVGDNLPEPLAVVAGDRWTSVEAAWRGDLLVFGPASDPATYVVGGTMLIDHRITGEEADDRAATAIVLGFGYSTTSDLSTATAERDGQVVIPLRTEAGVVTGLVDRWPGPVFLRAVPR